MRWTLIRVFLSIFDDQTFFVLAVNKIGVYRGDPEIGPPMGLTESGPILESVRFVKPANYKWRDTNQSVYRYVLLRVDIKVDY